MKLMTFYPSRTDGTSFYRGAGVLRYLNLLMPELQYMDSTPYNNFTWAEAMLCDVAFFQRSAGGHELSQMRILRECHRKIWVDYDDDLINIEGHNPVYGFYNSNKKIIAEICAMADIITVSTETLRQVILPYNKNVVVVPNAHNDYIYKVKDKPKFSYNKTAFYRGGHTHQYDLFAHVDSIVKMVEENQDWKFIFIGDRYPFIEVPLKKKGLDNLYVSNVMPLMEFFGAIYKMNACASFQFLENTPFNQAKSNISFLEGTYAGGGCFCPFSFVEFDKVPCVHYDSVDTAFAQMKEKDDLQGVHDRSWAYIQENLLLSNVNKQRAEILKNIL